MPKFLNPITITTPGASAPLIVNSSTLVSNLNADLLDGQHGSYFENRDATALGFSGGTLTLTRAAGNLTTSLDGRYLPLAGGTLTGGLSGTTGSFSGALSVSGTVQAGFSRLKVLDYNNNGTPTNGIRIATNIPQTSGVGMYTLIFEGYRYGDSNPEMWAVSFYIYNAGAGVVFYNVGGTCWGGKYPSLVQLGWVGGLANIFILTDLVYFRRFTVRAVAGNMSESTSHFEGWSASDSNPTLAAATGVVTVSFNNEFGNVAVKGALSSTGAITQGGNQVLHAGNYSSYALPLTGGTVSGVVRINNQLQVGQNTNGTAYIDAYGGYAWFGRDSNSTGIRIDGSANVHMTNTLNVVNAITQNGNQVLHAGNYTSYAQPIGTNLPYSWTNTADIKVFTGAYSYNTGVAKYLLLWQRTSGATGTNGRFVDGMLKVWRGANHAGNGGTVGYIHASSGYSGTSSEVLVYTPFTGQALSFFSVIYNSVEWVAISLPISDYRWELRGHYGIQGDTTTVPIQIQANDAGVGTITALTTTSYLLHTGTTSAPNLSIGGSAAQLNGQAASYYENRDTTAVGFSAGTLTLTRAAGNLTVSLDGRYLPLAGGTTTGAVTFGSTVVFGSSGKGRIYADWAADSSTRSFFAGRNSTDTDWNWGAEFGWDGANQRWYFDTVPFINGNAALHAGNYSSYALPLTGGTLTGALVGLAATFSGATNLSGGLTVSGSTHYVFNRPTTNNYQTVSLFGSTSGGLFLTTDSPIISTGAYYNNGWIATATSGTWMNFAGGGFDWSTFSGATIGTAPTWVSRMTMSAAGVLNVVGSITQGGNQVLHAGNVSTYALPIGGGTLAGNLTINGHLTMGSGYQHRASDGSAAAPGYSFNADTDTGIHRSADNTLALVTAGTIRATVGSTGTLNVVSALTLGGNPVLSESVVTFTPTTVGWYRIANAGGNSSGTIRISGFYDNRSAVLEFDYTVNGWNQGCSINLRNNNTYAGSLITQIRASNDVSTANGYLDIYIATATTPGPLTIYNFGPASASLVASPVVGAVVGTNVVKIANINNVMGFVTTGPINADTMAIAGNGTIGGTLGVTGVATFASATTFSAASGTYINTGGGSDAFGYNATAGRGHYIKGTGNTYIYGGGVFWDGSAIRTLLHSNNFSSYALPITGGTLTGELTIATGAASGLRVNSPSGTQGFWLRVGYDTDGTATPVASALNTMLQSSGSSAGTFTIVCGNTKVLSLSTGAINSLVALQQSGNQVLHAGNYSSYALPLTGGTLTGVLSIQNSSDNQLLLQGTDTWAGIGFRDSANVTDYIWYWGATQTFAIGGGGSAGVSGKKLHIDGGVTIGSSYDAVSMPTNGLNVEGAIQQAGNQVLHAGNYIGSYIAPQTNYTTVVDASGYTWIRIPYAQGDSFNGGQSPIEFYVTRSIYDNSSTPYGGPTAKFVIQSMEWHSGQQMGTVQYGERGDSSSLGASNWITHAKVTNLSGGGYWVYLRLRTTAAAGVTYMFRRAAVGGQGINFSAIESTTDPGGAARLYYGFNLISAGTEARFYRDGNQVIDAGGFSGSLAVGYGSFASPGITLGDAQYGLYVTGGNLYYKSASGGVHYWRNSANSANTMSLDNSGNVVAAGSVTGTSFSGAGTGLTGTAASLSIGGTAATATNIADGAVSTSAKIAASVVTYAKIQNVSVSTVLGNSSASVAQAPVEISMASLAGMLSGQTMNINGSSTSCTGNAATATNGFSFKPGWAGAQNLIADLANFNNSVPSGFYQYYQATNAPSATWYNLINVRHSNTGNDHGFQLAMSYYDETLWSRTYQGGTGANNGTFTTWRAHLHSGNYSSYALPLSGGTMTGSIQLPSGGYVGLNGGSTFGIGVLSSNRSSAVFDTVESTGTDPLELNYYQGGPVKIGSGANGSKSLYAVGIYDNGNQVVHAGNVSSYTIPLLSSVAEASLDTATATGLRSISKTGYSSLLLTLNAGGSTGPFQLDANYTGVLRWRNQTDSTTWTAWKTLIHDGNYTSYPPARWATGRSISLTGDVTGTSGLFDGTANLSFAATLANSGVTAGTYRSVTVDAKGRVTGGTNPTTIAGYGITDALSTTGATMTGALNVTGVDQGLAIQHNGNTAAWFGRIITKNSTSDRAAFLGTYGTIAGVFAHNNALNAWADLYINTVDGSGGGTVRMPSSVLVNGNQVIHTGNYVSYSPSLTGGGASGTWGINISGSSASCSGNAATATNASQLNGQAGSYYENRSPTAVSISAGTLTITRAAGNLTTTIGGRVVAWCDFNGNFASSQTPNANFNVSSITKNATGDYTVNFSSALANANYVVAGTAQLDTPSPGQSNYNVMVAVPRRSGAKATGSCRIVCEYPAGVALYDSISVGVAFIAA